MVSVTEEVVVLKGHASSARVNDASVEGAVSTTTSCLEASESLSSWNSAMVDSSTTSLVATGLSLLGNSDGNINGRFVGSGFFYT